MTAGLWSYASWAGLARLLLVPLLLSICAPSAVADEQGDAVKLVETVRQAALVLGHGGPAEAQLRSISAAFDGKGIAQAVLGTRWRSASADDRAAVVDALLYAIAHGLADKLERTQDKTFTVLGTKTLANGDTLVRSEFRRRLHGPTSVDWRVRRCRGQLCIGDVFVDGGSVTVRQRDRISQILAGNGGSIPALVVDLRKGRV
ncbi:ABC transporter substrate-binding protein [Mesorhizobium sp. B2-9-1]|uniref:Tgt2/MlaC family protein n=1 Tax=Mesorhizobium sp. B2-9-1 TaxID=2589898 RepID=UPI00112676DB|nr:ABC transporter substrate-binding protein [Mesorhizobium sp. B2-9-1]TPI43293.1 ABC transporter substrate-binding protein [Mesorhizobium sp. B2-9-1]TPJ20949.1 ABC transporter substrate-binding protein [Mesorhizobium sp. B2-7-2]